MTALSEKIERETVKSSKRTFAGIDEGRLASSEQAKPLTLAFGTFRTSGGWISPIFNDRAVPITIDTKISDPVTVGYNYFGYFAKALCAGPVDELTEILVGDKTLWSGSVVRSGLNAEGVDLTTEIGEIRLYWGNDVQTADEDLQSLRADQPAFRGVCYIVAKDVLFGQTPTPPDFQFELRRTLSEITLTDHDLDGDANLAEVLYFLHVDQRFCAGLPLAEVDRASFESSGEILIDEDLGASPVFSNPSEMREVAERILSYIRGVRYFDGGKLKLKLLRDDGETPIEITENDLLDEPEITPGDWADTWNETRVTYTNRENFWETDVQPYHDPANAEIVGATVQREINREWITRSSVAKVEANRIGTEAGLPLSTIKLSLKPRFRTLSTSSICKLVYPRLNITAFYFRPERIQIGGPDDPQVEVEGLEDATRNIALGYVPAGDELGHPGRIPQPLAAPTVRIGVLPTALKDGAADGMLVAVSRPTPLTVRKGIYFTWDPTLASYGQLSSGASFPIYLEVISWKRFGSNWVVRVQVKHSHEIPIIADFVEGFEDLYFISGRRVVETGGSDTHDLELIWAKRAIGGRFAAIDTDLFDIEVEPAQFSTEDFSLETSLAGSSGPTKVGYFGRLGDFTLIQSDSLAFERDLGNDAADSAKRRYFKAIVGDLEAMLSLGDVSAVEFKRSDTSMDPNGSYSPTWGSEARTSYELFDDEGGLEFEGVSGAEYLEIDDLDEALGRFFEGTHTAEDSTLWDDVDDVIGAYSENDNGIYNDSP